MHERREMERYSLRLPMSLQNGSRQQNAISRNISARGILFDCDSQFEGDEVTFVMKFPPQVTLSSSLRVRCQANVVRIAERTAAGTTLAVRIHRYEFLSQEDTRQAA
jgi:hypothetical protein